MTKLRIIPGDSSKLTTVDRTPGKPEWKYYISGQMLNMIWKKDRPEDFTLSNSSGRKRFSTEETYQIVKNKKGEYWCEWKSSIYCWINCWYEMPKAAGVRAEQIYDLIKEF